MSLSTTKNSVERFRGVTNCFSIVYHFGQISKFERGVTPGKKLNLIEFPACVHFYKVCPL